MLKLRLSLPPPAERVARVRDSGKGAQRLADLINRGKGAPWVGLSAFDHVMGHVPECPHLDEFSRDGRRSHPLSVDERQRSRIQNEVGRENVEVVLGKGEGVRRWLEWVAVCLPPSRLPMRFEF